MTDESELVREVEEAGMDTLTHAGNWANPDTPRIYIPQRRLHHLERARQIMEEEGEA